MTARLEWIKFTRNVIGLFFALHITVVSVLGGRPRASKGPHRSQLIAARSVDWENLQFLAELEQRKRTLFNNPRTQVR
jgi:hypothetical protein